MYLFKSESGFKLSSYSPQVFMYMALWWKMCVTFQNKYEWKKGLLWLSLLMIRLQSQESPQRDWSILLFLYIISLSFFRHYIFFLVCSNTIEREREREDKEKNILYIFSVGCLSYSFYVSQYLFSHLLFNFYPGTMRWKSQHSKILEVWKHIKLIDLSLFGYQPDLSLAHLWRLYPI
jgi:hypothetical protein